MSYFTGKPPETIKTALGLETTRRGVPAPRPLSGACCAPCGKSGGSCAPSATAGFSDDVGSVMSLAGGGAATYHGYRRTGSIGWALVWGALGAIFPLPTNAIALAQGFGKKK